MVPALPVLVLSLSALLGLAACAGAEPSGDEAPAELGSAELRPTYGHFADTLEAEDYERWLEVRRSLISGFDRICGDTICGGDYSNLATVRLTCSSTSKARKLKDCTWVLGGSIDSVHGQTGEISGESRAFVCKVPVGGNAKRLLDTLTAAGDDALFTPIPGTEASFYDALVECFDGVVGSPLPSFNEALYAELGDYFWAQSTEQGIAWSTTKRQLAEAFDEVCGDSFCEGDYPDITALGLSCSVEEATGQVSRCTWSFAAADTSVTARGAIEARTETQRCEIQIDAKADALAAVLSGADALHAPLPGKTTSLYDALIGCL